MKDRTSDAMRFAGRFRSGVVLRQIDAGAAHDAQDAAPADIRHRAAGKSERDSIEEQNKCRRPM